MVGFCCARCGVLRLLELAAQAAMSAIAPRRWLPVALLALIFFLPLLFAFLVYYGSSWRPSGHTNHGVLIEPPKALPAAALGLAGTSDAVGRLTGKWSLLYIGDGACDEACRHTLYYMRQTQLSLGNLIPRTQRVWLATAHCCNLSADTETDPPLLAMNASGDTASALLAQFPTDHRDSTIFIVDPLGNLMMRYDSSADPKGLREDLKKLLDLSHIG
jgi:cytochrome oxidase Cu insertion factor (SCO1/SenC/PrrC family)